MRVALLSTLFCACTGSEAFVGPQSVRCEDNDLPAPSVVRMASYNMKSGLETSLEAVGLELEMIRPDLVALQEVDHAVDRTGRIAQATALGERLGLQPMFAAAIERGGGAYGVGLLSRFPVQSVERVELGGFATWEPRVALNAVVCIGRKPVRVVSTHTDFLNPGGNIDALAEKIAPHVGEGLIVAGDLNVTPDSAQPKKLTDKGLVDLFAADERFTFWPSEQRLDYVYADSLLAPHAIDRQVGQVKASDHFPIWVDLRLPAEMTR